MLRLLMLAFFAVGAVAESGLLRGLGQKPENAVACLTEEQCRQQFEDVKYKRFYVKNNLSTKGCFAKNQNLYFGTGGTVEKMSRPNLPGVQERVWCERDTEEPVENSIELGLLTDRPTTKPPTKQPTLKPVTSPPTEQPTAKPVTFSPTTKPTAKPVTDSPTKRPTQKPVTDSPTNQPTSKPVTNTPTKHPTAKPVTDSPTLPPTEKPATGSPTKKPTQRPVTNSPSKQPTPKPVEDVVWDTFITMPPTGKPTQEPTINLMLASQTIDASTVNEEYASSKDATWLAPLPDIDNETGEEKDSPASESTTPSPTSEPTFSPTTQTPVLPNSTGFAPPLPEIDNETGEEKEDRETQGASEEESPNSTGFAPPLPEIDNKTGEEKEDREAQGASKKEENGDIISSYLNSTEGADDPPLNVLVLSIIFGTGALLLVMFVIRQKCSDRPGSKATVARDLDKEDRHGVHYGEYKDQYKGRSRVPPADEVSITSADCPDMLCC